MHQVDTATMRYSDNSKCLKSRNLYDPIKTFQCSRTTIEKFLTCPRCFYHENVCGLKKPPIPGYTLNIAVDENVKTEMMNHRSQGTTPEILKNQNLELFLHDDLKNWQKMNKGIRFLNEERNTEYFGLVDDVLVNKMGELVMVDTKSTSKKEEMTTLENVFNNGKTYQRQLEIYSYLFQKNGFPVNSTGYLLYYNAIKGETDFNGIMRFKTTLIPMKLDTSWIESCLENLHECLQKDEAPPPSEDCDFCLYVQISNLL